MELITREDAFIHGRIGLKVYDEHGCLKDECEGDNVICTTGYTALAAGLVWSGIQDQAANIGVTNPTYLTPLYGALGSGSGSPAKSDTQLFAELGRQTVTAGASSPATSSIAAQITWLFYFPVPPVSWMVTEAGVFANATASANSGGMIDHYVFSPAITLGTSDSAILQVSLSLGP